MKNRLKIIALPKERIERRILFLRGKKVMLDKELAELYEVETKALNQAVNRNKKRFPSYFMFRLNEMEMKILRSQFVTSSWGGMRYMAYAFTEQGIAMLSSVLSSERAIHVNIQIMRTFTRLREMMATHGELKTKIEKLEKKYDKRFQIVFEVIKKLLAEKRAEEGVPKRQIGFKVYS
ncbi:ORF6N domain-containing protein [Candidatus Peregrinibacteria bacterium]|nr:ORF6N domain-containing protein [Candidatus Peregrinibacteria bacterium]